MPRSPIIFILPPGTTPQQPNNTIESGDWNAAIDDIAQTFNTPTPVVYGGTGASSAADALVNLGIPTNVAQMATKVDTRRNRMVNGDKLVSQENLQTAGTTNGRYISDQNAIYFVSSAGVFTGVNVLSLSPAGGYRDRITITTADASLAAGEYLTYTQNIEGSNIRDAKWGTADAVPIIVRRGFKFPAGTYTVAFHNSGSSRSYVTSFVVSGGEANTDIVREFPVPGDTAGTWLSTDGVTGLVMDVVIAAGTTYQTTANAWQGGNFLTIAGTTNGIGTAASVFEFFDEGLKLDPDATGSYGVYEVGETDAKFKPMRYFRALGAFVTGIWGNANIGSFFVATPDMAKQATITSNTTTPTVFAQGTGPVTGVASTATVTNAYLDGSVVNVDGFSGRTPSLSAFPTANIFNANARLS